MTCVFSVGDETHVAVQRSQRVFAPDPSVGGSIGAEGARSALPSVYILAPRGVAYARSDAIGWGKYCKIHRTSVSSTVHRRTRTASPNPRAPTVTPGIWARRTAPAVAGGIGSGRSAFQACCAWRPAAGARRAKGKGKPNPAGSSCSARTPYARCSLLARWTRGVAREILCETRRKHRAGSAGGGEGDRRLILCRLDPCSHASRVRSYKLSWQPKDKVA
jgi:hypothetical protein